MISGARGVVLGPVVPDEHGGSHTAAREIPGRAFALGLAAVCAVGAALAGLTLAREPLGNDEIASLALVSRSLGAFLSDFAASQSAGLLFHVVLWPVVAIGGESAWALRLPSLVGYGAAIVVCGLVGARLGGRVVGLSAAALLALCPFAVLHAQDARMYTLALCLSLVAVWLLLRALERPTTVRWGLYAVTVALLGYSHELALLTVVAHVAFVVADGRRRVRAQFALALGAAALALLPLAALSAANAGSDPLYYVTKPGLGVFEDVALLFAGSRPGVAVFVLVLAVAGALAALRGGLSGDLVPGTWIALALWLVVPFAVLFVVSQARPLLLPRYLISSAAAACLLLALVLWRLRPALALSGLAVVLLALGYGAGQVVRTLERPDWQGVAAYLDGPRADGNSIVFVGGQRNAASFLYYAPGLGVRRDGLPWTQAELDRLPPAIAIVDRDNDVDDLAAVLARRPAWVVEQGALQAGKQGRLDRFLATCAVGERRAFRAISVTLVTRCPSG
jgi:mannosyltransferase